MRESYPTEASRYLVALARKNAEIYTGLSGLRAVIITGSSAEGVSDYFSDIDTILYYDALPSDEQLVASMNHNQGIDRRLLAERVEDGVIESYQVLGIECQFAHCTVTGWETDMAAVLEKLDVESPNQKALSGLLEAIPLYGEPLIRHWQAQAAAYPDALRIAMVEHFLVFTPIWGLTGRLQPRDANIWIHQMLVENAQHLIGVLAGLNRLYFSTFQFKRMRRLIDQMSIKPPDLAARLDAVFVSDPGRAGEQIESLVAETVSLVNQHMPQINTMRIKQRLGWRQPVWVPRP